MKFLSSIPLYLLFIQSECNQLRPTSLRLEVSKSILNRILLSTTVIGTLNFGSSLSSAEGVARGFQTKSGLKYYDIKEGDGALPRYGQLVAFTYTQFYKPKSSATLEKIDSSSVPFLHKHGNGRIVRGLDEAIHGMKVGGKRRAIIPSSIGKFDILNMSAQRLSR